VLTPVAARDVREPSVIDGDTWWSYFNRRIYDVKVLPVAGQPTYIVTIPGWRQRPELIRTVALAETFRHNMAHRVRQRLGRL
jgi:hypothetical protein